MNYQKHYDAMIARARTRTLAGYFEKHHVIPKCLGGSNDPANIVNLTPEEHFVAHQLLIKMFPSERKLIYAAQMMTNWSKTNPERKNNKFFGWLKRRVAEDRRNQGAWGTPFQKGLVPHNKGKTVPYKARRKRTPEERAAQSARSKGMKLNLSPEERARRAEQMKINRINSLNATRLANPALGPNPLLGRKMDEEYRRIRSIGQQRRRARERSMNTQNQQEM